MNVGDIIKNAQCVDISNQGKGIVFADNKKIFVDGLLPDEEATIKITKKTSKFVQGAIIEITKENPERVTPKCTHFGESGGCDLEHMSYKMQCALKDKNAQRDMKLAVKDMPFTFNGFVPSPQEYGYRNKMIFSLTRNENGTIMPAFYKTGTKQKYAIDTCYLMNESMENILRIVIELLNEYLVDIYDEKTNEGLLKRICIRRNADSSQHMVIFITKDKNAKQLYEIADRLVDDYAIDSVYQNIQPLPTSEQMGKEDILLAGVEYLVDTINELKFYISPQAFFQINPEQMEQIYTYAIDQIDEGVTLLDLYSGVGTIGLLASQKVARVKGVELNTQAAKQAKRNARANGIANAKYVSGDVLEYIQNYERKSDERLEVIIDPPRSGCDATFLRLLTQLKPEKIVYISCNPRSLAQDAYILRKNGYVYGDVKLFDMFPQTLHTEAVLVFEPYKK